MTLRAPLLTLLVGTLTLTACNREAPVPEAADTAGLAERSVEEQALYLSAYRIGESVREQDQDSVFLYDVFLQGLRDGFAADSAHALAYLFGYQNGAELAANTRLDSSLSDDITLYVAGFRDGYNDQPMALTEAQDRAVSEAMQMRQLQRQARTNPRAQAFLDQVTASKASADSVLAAVRQREGVQSTENGVLFFVEQEGEGESPEAGDRVLVTYEGRLPDGTPFDRSEEPVDFVLGAGLIPGMTEALVDMQIGERREIVIPPDLGYGMQGIPNSPIGPNTVLMFTVELVDILDPVADEVAPGTQAPTSSR